MNTDAPYRILLPGAPWVGTQPSRWTSLRLVQALDRMGVDNIDYYLASVR